MNSTRRYQKVKLAELISQVVRSEKITDVKNEHYITLSSYGKGAHERVIKDEKYPVPFTGYRVSKGQFIYSRIDARNGAYDIIGPELEGFVVSKDFPIYDINIEKVLPRFLLRSVLSDSFIRQVKQSSFGATNRMRIKEEVFDNYSISLPTISEQKEMSDTLDLVQSIIGSKERQLSLLDNLIKARFVELFGNSIERRRLEEYTILITKGASPKWQGIDYCDEGTLFVTSENVREGYVDLAKRKYLPNEINNILPRSVLQRNDVLINIVGASIGRAAIFESDELANINQAVALVRLKEDVLNRRFLITFLNSEEALKAYGSMKKGGARDNLSLKNIADLMIPVATKREQEQFAAFVKQVDKSKAAVQKSLDETQLLFDSLMQQYFA